MQLQLGKAEEECFYLREERARLEENAAQW
jgi:hypothetical protein